MNQGHKAVFKYLFEEGRLTEDIANDLHVVKTKQLMIQTFTKEQVVFIFEQPAQKTFTGYRDFTMMMLFLKTEMRITKGTDGHVEFRSNICR